MTTDIKSAAQRVKSLILVLILTGQLMLVLDASVVTTALPEIQSSLHFGSANLSWVQNAYTLTFGGLLLLGARAGDILGRRKTFTIGIAVFTLASLAGGAAQSSDWLLISRAVQGIAAAAAAPSTLALLMQTFTEPKERTRAVALFSGVTGAGASLGLVMGGLLTDLISWRFSLFINVPIGIALVAMAPRLLKETERKRGHFDVIGAITSTIGMASLVYGFVRAAADGWSNIGAISSFVIGIALMVSFVLNERRVEQPITPLHLFKSRERSGANFARLLMVGGMFSMFFFTSQYMQEVLHFSAIKAGLAYLPLTGVMFAMVQIIPKIAPRLGNARTASIGLATAAVGMFWLSRIGADSSYLTHMALPMLVVGAGMGTAFIPSTTLGISGVAPEDAGAASGLLNVSQQVGGSLGLAILVTVFTSSSRSINGGVGPEALAHGVSSVLTGSSIALALAFSVMTFVVGRAATRKQQTADFEQTIELAS